MNILRKKIIKHLLIVFIFSIALITLVVGASVVYATHSWRGYHFARTTANPFNLKLGDNVSTNWDSHLITASNDWSLSSVLDTTIVSGAFKKNCGPVNGRVEVCDKTYGNNGWLGVAQIWISGSHITQGTVKLNDTYFNTPTYNTPAWRQFVVCQEVGHTFGLAHQDESFKNANLGSCMDYTNDPDGTLFSQLSNLHPNIHDYDELGIIYSHLDSINTVFSSIKSKFNKEHIDQNENRDEDTDLNEKKDWGKAIKHDARGKDSLYKRDLENGDTLFTFIIWAD